MANLDPAATLHRDLVHAGIPIVGVGGPPWVVSYDPSATQAQIDQGNSMAASFDGKGRQARLLTAIYNDVRVLTTAQLGRVWADIAAAVPEAPRKYLADAGPNAAALFVMDWVVYVQAPTGAQLTAARNNIIAQFVQDNPLYLVTPSFDSTITVYGDEAPP